MVTKQIGTAEAGRQWRQIIDDVSGKDTHFVVEDDGKPVAAVVPMHVYERMRQERAEFFDGLREMAQRANLSPEEADALAEEAVQAIRRGEG